MYKMTLKAERKSHLAERAAQRLNYAWVFMPALTVFPLALLVLVGFQSEVLNTLISGFPSHNIVVPHWCLLLLVFNPAAVHSKNVDCAFENLHSRSFLVGVSRRPPDDKRENVAFTASLDAFRRPGVAGTAEKGQLLLGNKL